MRFPGSRRWDGIDLQQVFGTDKLVCPWHDDKDPSLHIYPDHIFCYGCRRRFSPVSLLKQLHGFTTKKAQRYLRSFHGRPYQSPTKVVQQEVSTDLAEVRSWNAALLASPDKQSWLFARGVAAHLLTDLCLGWKDGRAYAIPHFFSGTVENIKFRIHPDFQMDGDRRYDSLAHHRFRGLYPHDYFEQVWKGHTDTVLIAEGEFDAMVLLGARLPAVSIPSGATWDLTPWSIFLRQFQRIVLLYDMDKTGSEHAKKAQETMPRKLGREVLIESWNPDWGKDVTDARERLLPRLLKTYGT